MRVSLTLPIFVLADAEVISIDAFVKTPNGVIIGVTLVKVCTSELNVELFKREIQIPKSSHIP